MHGDEVEKMQRAQRRSPYLWLRMLSVFVRKLALFQLGGWVASIGIFMLLIAFDSQEATALISAVRESSAESIEKGLKNFLEFCFMLSAISLAITLPVAGMLNMDVCGISRVLRDDLLKRLAEKLEIEADQIESVRIIN